MSMSYREHVGLAAVVVLAMAWITLFVGRPGLALAEFSWAGLSFLAYKKKAVP